MNPRPGWRTWSCVLSVCCGLWFSEIAGALALEEPAPTPPAESPSAECPPAETPPETSTPADSAPALGEPSQQASEPAAESPQADAPAEPLAGHSIHGEAFNDGPRQRAYLMKAPGEVSFPITSQSSEAQAFFNQGVAQLHGFWYFEAERAFRHVAALDEQCAMAYWGMAMANRENEARAVAFIKEAVRRKEKVTRREQLWIDTLASFFGVPLKAEALDQDASPAEGEKTKRPNKPSGKDRWQKLMSDTEQILAEFPHDLEAKAFLTWAIWDGNSHGVPITSYEAADALIQQVLDAAPMHPGAHHYRIHLWDRQRAERALASAALIGPAGASIAHLWHMAGHIYDKLDRRSDAAWQQEAAVRVDHAYQMRDHVMPYQIHNYAHNSEWLVRSLMHVGRAHHAATVARNLIDIPRHPKYNDIAKSGSCAAYGRQRLFDVLLNFELWDELIAAAEGQYLEATDTPAEQAKRLRALGAAYFAKSDADRVAQQIAAVEALAAEDKQTAEAEATAAADKARGEGKPDDQVEKTRSEVIKQHETRRRPFDQALVELQAYSALLAGRDTDAVELLKKMDGVAKPRLSRLYLRANQPAKAEELAREAVKSSATEVVSLANLVDILFTTGKTAEASEVFGRLAKAAADAELDLPILERMAPVAAALGKGADWREPRPATNDLGERPPMDELGPLEWRPVAAGSWTLSDDQGATLRLEDFQGKPVVMICYLGIGCLHCVAQLEAFAPMAEEFSAQGISLVGISTDDLETLARSRERFQGTDGKPFPFPLLSDANHEVFHAYRAFDDFEGAPLHGTFLIDGAGLIRWQDISFEPFTDPKALLAEARRLLAQSPNP